MNNTSFFRWNVITNVCMALSINTTAVLLSGGDTISGWVQGCCCAFTINTIAAVIIPVGKIGRWFAQDVCKTREGTFAEIIARNFIVNAIYVTIVSFCMSLIHLGAGPELIPAWLSTYLQLHLVGLITGIVIEKPVAALNRRLEAVTE